VRLYDRPQTPLARILANKAVNGQKKKQLLEQAARLNPFALWHQVDLRLKEIDRIRILTA
jgi:hypothetical protein